MVDVAQEIPAIDVAEELKDRFLGMYWWYLEGMEFRPGFKLSKKETVLAKVFEKLHDSVDAIPVDMMTATRALYAQMSPLEFENILEEHLVAVGRTSAPKSAAEFLEALNLSLSTRA